MGVPDQAATSLALSFLLTPFGGLGYLFVMAILFYEFWVAWTCTDPYCLSERFVVIASTVFGRVLGEVIWPFVVCAGAGVSIF